MGLFEGFSRRRAEVPEKPEPVADQVEMSLVDEMRELEHFPEKLRTPVATEAELNARWERIEKIKVDLQQFLARAAASDTVGGALLAGFFEINGETGPAIAAASVAGVLDIAAYILNKRVTHKVERVEQGLRNERGHLSPEAHGAV